MRDIGRPTAPAGEHETDRLDGPNESSNASRGKTVVGRDPGERMRPTRTWSETDAVVESRRSEAVGADTLCEGRARDGTVGCSPTRCVHTDPARAVWDRASPVSRLASLLPKRPPILASQARHLVRTRS